MGSCILICLVNFILLNPYIIVHPCNQPLIHLYSTLFRFIQLSEIFCQHIFLNLHSALLDSFQDFPIFSPRSNVIYIPLFQIHSKLFFVPNPLILKFTFHYFRFIRHILCFFGHLCENLHSTVLDSFYILVIIQDLFDKFTFHYFRFIRNSMLMPCASLLNLHSTILDSFPGRMGPGRFRYAHLHSTILDSFRNT